ncbi:MAG: L,D-transpeptidase [Thermodesulfobacteriota bacterium]
MTKGVVRSFILALSLLIFCNTEVYPNNQENSDLSHELIKAGFTVLGVGEQYQVPYVEVLVPNGTAIYSLCRKVPSLNARFFEAREKIAYFNALDPFFIKKEVDEPNSFRVKTLKIPLDLSLEPVIFPEFDEALAHYDQYLLIDIGKSYLALYTRGVLTRVYPISPGTRLKGSRTRTPLISFTVLSKDENHWSNIYESWMPWSLLIRRPYFIHGGCLPGTPDSHGCIRLFNDHAQELFNLVEVGTPGRVIFSDTSLAQSQFPEDRPRRSGLRRLTRR